MARLCKIGRQTASDEKFRVIIGYDGDTMICPDFTNAQRKPANAPVYSELDVLYIIGDKIEPRYKLIDGLRRILYVMECNANENLYLSVRLELG